MKHFFLACALVFATPAFAQQPPEIRFHSAPDFLQLPPDLYLGEVTGVAVNSQGQDRKSTRLNSSHSQISYAVFCLKKKNASNCSFSLNIRECAATLQLLTSYSIRRCASPTLSARWTSIVPDIPSTLPHSHPAVTSA